MGCKKRVLYVEERPVDERSEIMIVLNIMIECMEEMEELYVGEGVVDTNMRIIRLLNVLVDRKETEEFNDDIHYETAMDLLKYLEENILTKEEAHTLKISVNNIFNILAKKHMQWVYHIIPKKEEL